MALVTKNDVTQIFAIQAPEVDLPPTFANYPRGWDTARSTNGKPTIKQFNYIQQRTDQNILWIHQNGAALPYDAAMEYAEGAVVVKDGVLQKKQGESWIIPFMRGSQNLAELTDVTTARTNLSVYSKAEALAKASNLSDLANKATARTNLDVYSKAETNSIAGTPNATETVAGKAKIATTAIAKAGVNDTDFITPKKLRDVLNATGGAPISACRAWVCFDSTTGGTIIRASNNIQSIVRTSQGKFVITFINEMPHSDYIVLTGTRSDASENSATLNLVVNEASIKSTQNAKTTKTLSVVLGNNIGFLDSYGMSLGVFC